MTETTGENRVTDTADDRMTESADMVTEAPDNDPADLSGTAADETAEQMHGEVDEIAAGADEDGLGHGPKG